MPLVAKSNSGNSNSNYVNQVLAKFLPYWPIFILVLLICFAFAWYKIQSTPEKYLSSTSILVSEKKKGTDESKVIESLNPILTPEKVVENEMEIFRSKSLMTKVATNLHLYASLDYKDGFKWVSAYTKSPVKVIVQDPDSLFASRSFDVKLKNDGKEVLFQNKPVVLDTWVDTDLGKIKFVKNKHYDGSNVKDLRLTITPPNKVASSLSSQLNVKPLNKATAILSVEIVNEIPLRGENILNELLKMYNLEAMLDKNKNAKQTLEFVEERLAQQKRELDSIEGRVQNYKTSNGGINLSEEGRVFLTNVSEADQKLQEINLQLSVLNQVEEYVKSKDRSTGIVPSTLGVNNEMLSKLLTRLYDTELQKEELKKTVAENNPTLVAIDNQIEKIRPSILENIGNQRKALESNRSSVQRAGNVYSSMLNSIPQKERQLIAISRDHSIKSDVYSFLLQKREEAALTFATQVPESRVVDQAFTYPTPLEPQPLKNYLNALAIGMLISIGIVYGKEALNNKVLFRSEIENATALPIISEITHNKSKELLIPQDGRNTVLASQFRKLRTSLSFLGIDEHHKKLMITSTVSGEGKSFIAANLGLSLAATGKKVVLVEFDMINPSLSEKFGFYENKGLSNFINGELDAEHIIHKTKNNENLFIIPSGPEPTNPSEMILSSRVEELVTYLETHFDYVIIDTAPVGPIPDAYILSSYCDATLYIIRHKYTPKKYIQRIDEENKIHPLKNAAIVFNGIKSRGFTKNSYGMGYGYGHEYIYEKKIGKKGSYIVS